MKIRELNKAMALVLSVSLLLSLINISACANDAYHFSHCCERVQFDLTGRDPYIYEDYAYVHCTDWGGEFTDTDFSAVTYGKDSRVYNLTKVLNVCAILHDNGDEYSYPFSQYDLHYSASGSYGCAEIDGSDYVNDEYGLCDFTTFHWLTFYDSRYTDFNGNIIEWEHGPTIEIYY